jgi:hypothetical protein
MTGAERGVGHWRLPIAATGPEMDSTHEVSPNGCVAKNHLGHKNTEHHFSSGGSLEEIGLGHRQTSEENSGSGQSTIIDT